MSDNFTELNMGVGGSVMDESSVTYPTAPVERLRPRVVIGGDDDKAELAKVTNDSPSVSDYGLVVRNIPYWSSHMGTAVYQFGSISNIQKNTVTTICSITVPTNKRFIIKGFSSCGDLSCKYYLYKNTDLLLTGRGVATNPNVQLGFLNTSIYGSQSDLIELKVEHFTTEYNGSFDGTILGYLIDL